MKYAIALLFGAVLCNANSITYAVNQTVGLGSVTGSITTDGTIGVLTQTNTVHNISAFNLLLNDGTVTFDLIGPQPLSGPKFGANADVELWGTSVSATPDQLLFDFNNTAPINFLLFEAPGISSGIDYWCIGVHGCGNSEILKITGGELFALRSGSFAIAGTPTIIATPELSSALLLLSGLAGIGGLKHFWHRYFTSQH